MNERMMRRRTLRPGWAARADGPLGGAGCKRTALRPRAPRQRHAPAVAHLATTLRRRHSKASRQIGTTSTSLSIWPSGDLGWRRCGGLGPIENGRGLAARRASGFACAVRVLRVVVGRVLCRTGGRWCKRLTSEVLISARQRLRAPPITTGPSIQI